MQGGGMWGGEAEHFGMTASRSGEGERKQEGRDKERRDSEGEK